MKINNKIVALILFFQSFSCFAFAQNAHYPAIIITDVITGSAWVEVDNLHGNEHIYKKVPTYRVILQEVKNMKIIKEYFFDFTRDAWVVEKKAKGSYHLLNLTVEPPKPIVCIGRLVDFKRTGEEAILLYENDKKKISCKTFNQIIKSKISYNKTAISTEIMLHIGGKYQKKDKNEKIAASLGCFLFIPTFQKDKDFHVVKKSENSNKDYREFIKIATKLLNKCTYKTAYLNGFVLTIQNRKEGKDLKIAESFSLPSKSHILVK